jgi:hypothetical protein
MERMIAVALTSTRHDGLGRGIGDNDGLGFAREKKKRGVAAYLEGFDVARSGIY